MADIKEKVLPSVEGLVPYQPGKPIETLAREIGLNVNDITKLASNENPRGPSSLVKQAVMKQLEQLSRYPDGDSFSIKKALSLHFGISKSCIAVGNGSNELLMLLARIFLDRNTSSIFSQYAFIVYKIATCTTGAIGIEVPASSWGHNLSAIAAAVKPNTRIIYLANPNNPTGTCFDHDSFVVFMEKIPDDVVVVLDEAYAEYVTNKNYPDSLQLRKIYANLVIVRTFSKAYGLAGCRIGYCIASEDIVHFINKIRDPFNVNSVAQIAAGTALSDYDYLLESQVMNRSGMMQLQQELRKLNTTFIPSSANFITIEIPENICSSEIYQRLLSQGVIIRPLAGYNMPRHIRVTVGTPKDNEIFIESFKKCMRN